VVKCHAEPMSAANEGKPARGRRGPWGSDAGFRVGWKRVYGQLVLQSRATGDTAEENVQSRMQRATQTFDGEEPCLFDLTRWKAARDGTQQYCGCTSGLLGRLQNERWQGILQLVRNRSE
jgi:hypothetical protein